jgi:hypothetical protein
MNKKSLLLGAAAFALLVLFAFVGCSNPSSGSTEYVTQASGDYPYPADTVFVNDRAALDGLLNDYDASTNQVRHIAFRGGSATVGGLDIPGGKTVYLAGDYSAAITGDIIVREGAVLVLVTPFTAGNTARLLVRGSVEVFNTLKVTNDALDVSNYTDETDITRGRKTVIGTNVKILPGATLILDVDDIIPPHEVEAADKFTPAQAWAAAGQGHLVIGTNSTPRNPSPADALPNYFYTVEELLRGVDPNPNRTYTVVSGRFTSEELRWNIPAGAYITTSAIPTISTSAAKDELVINGSLTIAGTLDGITKLTVGNGGSLVLTEPSGELLRGLEELHLGPGAIFDIDPNPDVSLESLKTLFLGDGSGISVTGHKVTFNKAGTPIDLTIGKNVTNQIQLSASAKIKTKIEKDASLVNSSELIVYPGSTFEVAEGVTFTVEGGSVFDISKLPIPPTGDTPDVKIAGAVEIAGTGVFVGPAFATVAANPENLYKAFELEGDGKVVLNHGATFYLGSDSGPEFVGPTTGATYRWASTAPNDGAQIEINDKGLIIRDINGFDSTISATMVAVTVEGSGAGVLKDQSLTLERGVTLTITDGINNALWLIGDTETAGGGATLLGPGTLAFGGTGGPINIVGGTFGWKAFGDSIAIGSISNAPALRAVTSVIPAPAQVAATLKAQGLGATINVGAKTLDVAANTTIDLNGSNSREAGVIDLLNTGKISLALDTSKILTGAIPAGQQTGVALAGSGSASAASGGALTAIGVAGLEGDTKVLAVTNVTFNTTTSRLDIGQLYSLTGPTASGPGEVTATDTVSISSQTATDDI